MCGRFEVFTYEEVAAIVAAVEGRAPDNPAFPSEGPRAQARPGNSVLLFGRQADNADGSSRAANVESSDDSGNAPSAANANANRGDSAQRTVSANVNRAASVNALVISESTWGFEAEWSGKPVFNTRIESALSASAMWRGPIQNGRCIIPAAAFYEPHASETVRNPRTGRAMRRQYRFALPDGEPLLLAGVQAGGRCSVVTCRPNRWVAPIHDRMPLTLRFEEVATWLSPDWPALANRADRTGLRLVIDPEQPSSPDQPAQLTLF